MESTTPKCEDPKYTHLWARYKTTTIKCLFCGAEKEIFIDLEYQWRYEALLPKHPDADKNLR